MSHTNTTPNYNLPQFVGTDKPAWLTDINQAFSSIDTAIKSASDTANTANGNATTANNSIGTIASLNTTEKSTLVGAINEVNTNLGTVSGVASGASVTSTQAKELIDDLSAYLTLNTFASVTATSNGTIYVQNINCATNTDGSVAKLYGTITVYISNASGLTVTIPTNMRPTSELTINSACIFNWDGEGHAPVCQGTSMKITTDGNVTVSLPSSWYNRSITITFIPCMLFLKNFGDTPITPNS